MTLHMTMTDPCGNCPFRSDRPFPLSADRVTEIEGSLVRAAFPCHKTLDYDRAEDTDGGPAYTAKTQHCAGALILLERLERPSDLMQIAGRLGIYDPSRLNMNAPVYRTFDAMREGCSAANGFIPAHMAIRAAVASLRLPAVAVDGDCLRVSPRVVQRLGPGARLVLVTGWIDYRRKLLAFMHQAVRYRGWIVDATATQFDPELPSVVIDRPAVYRVRMRSLIGTAGTERVILTPQPR